MLSITKYRNNKSNKMQNIAKHVGYAERIRKVQGTVQRVETSKTASSSSRKEIASWSSGLKASATQYSWKKKGHCEE